MRRYHFLGLHFFPPGSQTLCCVSPAFIFLCAHTSRQHDGDFFFLVLALRAQERQSTPHQIKSLVLSGLGARLLGVRLCVLVCLSRVRTAGGRDPRGGVALSQHHPGGLDTSSPLAAALICSVSWRWPA